MVQMEIRKIIEKIKPIDGLEEIHKKECLAWIDSGVGIFRVAKPDVPDKHLVSYFCLCDFNRRKILLVEHLKAGLWLPSGGHVEPDEHPRTTVIRECKEELSLEARFWMADPILITSTVTVGLTAGHTDVSLWYILEGDSSVPIKFDQEEFASVKWFSFDDIPYSKSDPHMKRFIEKFSTMLG